jgi:hypothetical protein
MIKYGVTARGTQRWRCKACNNTTVWRKKYVHYQRQFVWFKQWIVQGFTTKQLAEQSGHSEWVIRKTISYWLQHPPVVSSIEHTTNCIFDGTYLDHKHGLLVMVDTQLGVVAGEYGMKEKSTDLNLFFHSLAERGLCPKSITVDGNTSVCKALQRQWPQAIVQRCLVHIQRQGLMWCRRIPKRLDARKLRLLFLGVTAITTHSERTLWLTQLISWEARYGVRIAASRETGWVFSDLKRARSMLLKALPNMFHYLDHSEIPRTTNMLEGYFGRLKDRYHDHRGLSLSKRSAYFQWYLYLCRR